MVMVSTSRGWPCAAWLAPAAVLVLLLVTQCVKAGTTNHGQTAECDGALAGWGLVTTDLVNGVTSLDGEGSVGGLGCQEGCTDCEDFYSSSGCLACASDYTAIRDSSRSGFVTCLSRCGDGEYRPPGSNDPCAGCNAACTACDGGSAADCLACKDGLLRVPADDGAHYRCVDHCPPGRFRSTHGTCLLCDAPCTECAGSPAHCTACPQAPPWRLDNNNCTTAPPPVTHPLCPEAFNVTMPVGSVLTRPECTIPPGQEAAVIWVHTPVPAGLANVTVGGSDGVLISSSSHPAGCWGGLVHSITLTRPADSKTENISFSVNATVQTAGPCAPEVPGRVETAWHDECVVTRWDVPAVPTGVVITGYEIEYTLLHSAAASHTKSAIIAAGHHQPSHGHHEYEDCSSVPAGAVYNVRVRAHSTDGPSEFSERREVATGTFVEGTSGVVVLGSIAMPRIDDASRVYWAACLDAAGTDAVVTARVRGGAAGVRLVGLGSDGVGDQVLEGDLSISMRRDMSGVTSDSFCLGVATGSGLPAEPVLEYAIQKTQYSSTVTKLGFHGISVAEALLDPSNTSAILPDARRVLGTARMELNKTVVAPDGVACSILVKRAAGNRAEAIVVAVRASREPGLFAHTLPGLPMAPARYQSPPYKATECDDAGTSILSTEAVCRAVRGQGFTAAVSKRVRDLVEGIAPDGDHPLHIVVAAMHHGADVARLIVRRVDSFAGEAGRGRAVLSVVTLGASPSSVVAFEEASARLGVSAHFVSRSHSDLSMQDLFATDLDSDQDDGQRRDRTMVECDGATWGDLSRLKCYAAGLAGLHGWTDSFLQTPCPHRTTTVFGVGDVCDFAPCSDSEGCGDHGMCFDERCLCVHPYIGARCNVPCPQVEVAGFALPVVDCDCDAVVSPEDRHMCFNGTAMPCAGACGHGRCDAATDECVCNKGYTGERCQMHHCSEPCAHGGRCTGPETCSCRGVWTGIYCTTRGTNHPPANGTCRIYPASIQANMTFSEFDEATVDCTGWVDPDGPRDSPFSYVIHVASEPGVLDSGDADSYVTKEAKSSLFIPETYAEFGYKAFIVVEVVDKRGGRAEGARIEVAVNPTESTLMASRFVDMFQSGLGKLSVAPESLFQAAGGQVEAMFEESLAQESTLATSTDALNALKAVRKANKASVLTPQKSVGFVKSITGALLTSASDELTDTEETELVEEVLTVMTSVIEGSPADAETSAGDISSVLYNVGERLHGLISAGGNSSHVVGGVAIHAFQSAKQPSESEEIDVANVCKISRPALPGVASSTALKAVVTSRAFTGTQTAATNVVSVSFVNLTLTDLADPIVIRMTLLAPIASGKKPQCVYYDVGTGSYLSENVATVVEGTDVACHTTHLTDFTVLVVDDVTAPLGGGDDSSAAGGSSSLLVPVVASSAAVLVAAVAVLLLGLALCACICAVTGCGACGGAGWLIKRKLSASRHQASTGVTEGSQEGAAPGANRTAAESFVRHAVAESARAVQLERLDPEGDDGVTARHGSAEPHPDDISSVRPSGSVLNDAPPGTALPPAPPEEDMTEPGIRLGAELASGNLGGRAESSGSHCNDTVSRHVVTVTAPRLTAAITADGPPQTREDGQHGMDPHRDASSDHGNVPGVRYSADLGMARREEPDGATPAAAPEPARLPSSAPYEDRIAGSEAGLQILQRIRGVDVASMGRPVDAAGGSPAPPQPGEDYHSEMHCADATEILTRLRRSRMERAGLVDRAHPGEEDDAARIDAARGEDAVQTRLRHIRMEREGQL